MNSDCRLLIAERNWTSWADGWKRWSALISNCSNCSNWKNWKSVCCRRNRAKKLNWFSLTASESRAAARLAANGWDALWQTRNAAVESQLDWLVNHSGYLLSLNGGLILGSELLSTVNRCQNWANTVDCVNYSSICERQYWGREKKERRWVNRRADSTVWRERAASESNGKVGASKRNKRTASLFRQPVSPVFSTVWTVCITGCCLAFKKCLKHTRSMCADGGEIYAQVAVYMWCTHCVYQWHPWFTRGYAWKFRQPISGCLECPWEMVGSHCELHCDRRTPLCTTSVNVSPASRGALAMRTAACGNWSYIARLLAVCLESIEETCRWLGAGDWLVWSPHDTPSNRRW